MGGSKKARSDLRMDQDKPTGVFQSRVKVGEVWSNDFSLGNLENLGSLGMVGIDEVLGSGNDGAKGESSGILNVVVETRYSGPTIMGEEDR